MNANRLSTDNMTIDDHEKYELLGKLYLLDR